MMALFRHFEKPGKCYSGRTVGPREHFPVFAELCFGAKVSLRCWSQMPPVRSLPTPAWTGCTLRKLNLRSRTVSALGFCPCLGRGSWKPLLRLTSLNYEEP